MYSPPPQKMHILQEALFQVMLLLYLVVGE